MVEVKKFNQTLETKLKISMDKEVITKNFKDNALKDFSLEVRNDPRTRFLQRLISMNDRVKIYKKAFYSKEPQFVKDSDAHFERVEAQRKLRQKERKLMNKADGTNFKSSFVKPSD